MKSQLAWKGAMSQKSIDEGRTEIVDIKIDKLKNVVQSLKNKIDSDVNSKFKEEKERLENLTKAVYALRLK